MITHDMDRPPTTTDMRVVVPWNWRGSWRGSKLGNADPGSLSHKHRWCGWRIAPSLSKKRADAMAIPTDTYLSTKRILCIWQRRMCAGRPGLGRRRAVTGAVPLLVGQLLSPCPSIQLPTLDRFEAPQRSLLSRLQGTFPDLIGSIGSRCISHVVGHPSWSWGVITRQHGSSNPGCITANSRRRYRGRQPFREET